uniref:G domain-containing protein n=1 Tax=Moniliophthora roreri TaxID=221103 RepID=A0A0W0FUE1_MONRR
MHSRRLSDGTVQTPHSRITISHGRDPEDVVKKHVPRFRVLVMGRRNAGKTTILQKMTQSSDGQFVVHDSNGNQVDPGSILQPSVERGRSRIDWEITYPSNERFVFHDSRGMEAGSRDELETLKDFIKRRIQRVPLSEKLHVIWYCLPTDTSRPLCHEEMAFFEQGTGDVPVIAVFTKFEDRITKAFSQLRDGGMSLREARRHEIPACRLRLLAEQVAL